MCKNCDWEYTLEEIKALEENRQASFASNTLESVRNWVESNQHITDKQRAMIENIGERVGSR